MLLINLAVDSQGSEVPILVGTGIKINEMTETSLSGA